MSYPPMQRAEAFIRTGEFTDALEALEEYLIDNPHDDDVLRLKASVLQRLHGADNLEQSLAIWQSLQQPISDDWMRRSIIHERLNQMDEAIHTQRQALALLPSIDDDETQRTYDRVVERLVMLLAQENHFAEAHDLLRQQPRQWRWLQWEADLLVMEGNNTQASESYSQALEQLQAQIDVRPSPHLNAIKGRILLARAHIYRRQHDITKARQHYEEASQLLAHDPLITFNLGCLQALEGQLQQAIALCEPVWVAYPSGALREQMQATLSDDSAYDALRQYLENL
jgi:tetratricopeptide (TPR) repeat protein